MIGVGLTLGLMAAAVVCAYVLVSASIRLGDQQGDAQVTVGAAHAHQPDGDLALAVVSVGNPSCSPVVVSVVARPVKERWARLWSPWRAPLSVRVPVPSRRPRPAGGTLLGAVEAGSWRSWEVPLAHDGSAASVAVRVDQGHRRTRIVTFVLERASSGGAVAGRRAIPA